MHSQEAESRVLANLWGVGRPVTRGPRPRLTLEEVADAGIAVADDVGLDQLLLGTVSSRLGVATTALYRYVASKDELIELVIDRAVGPAVDLTDVDWRLQVGRWSRALLDRYRQHPWLAGVQPAGEPRFPNAIGWIEVLLVALRDAPVAEPMQVALLLDSLARTFARLPGASVDTAGPAWLYEAIADRYPLFAREAQRDWSDVDEEFDRAIETVVRGATRPGSGSRSSQQ
ncbi:MAG TPA: TetR/AcrR family transcriptional regulator [Nocardioidaceae bacterium]|nr:TetR/AcrR family transcriptional regulator [Nocardioidaceae bacterium]